jgi:hypothetical protein
MSKRLGPGQVEITFRFSRHIGGTFIQGGLTLQLDGLKPYAFVSRAHWPATDNYEAAVRETVEQVLQERQGHLASTHVTLKAIDWDDVTSCEIGFRSAARAAIHAAFDA